jgi:hypothetical protein
VVGVPEAAEVSEAVATVEAAEAVTGTSVGLAEEQVVAEDAESKAFAKGKGPYSRCRELDQGGDGLRLGRMKKFLVILSVALLITGCGGSDSPRTVSEEASFNASLMAKCEACGNGLSKQAEDCSGCRHPNPIPIAVLKEKADEKKRLAQLEIKRLEGEHAKRLAEMEEKALAEMEASQLKKISDEASRQKPKLATTLLDLDTVGGEKPTKVIIARHPNASFNGIYQAQAKLVNGYVYYKNENDRHLYFYDQAEGGQKGWSLDHREPDGIKDHYSGGWYYCKSFSHLNSNCDEWRNVH